MLVHTSSGVRNYFNNHVILHQLFYQKRCFPFKLKTAYCTDTSRLYLQPPNVDIYICSTDKMHLLQQSLLNCGFCSTSDIQTTSKWHVEAALPTRRYSAEVQGELPKSATVRNQLLPVWRHLAGGLHKFPYMDTNYY